jgi:heme A synthase
MPSRRLPIIGGATVLTLALPIFIVAHWPFGGWVIAAVLWIGAHALDLAVARAGENVAMRGFAMFFKPIGVLAVLLSTIVANKHMGVAALITYALAYTCELGLSLVAYFGESA